MTPQNKTINVNFYSHPLINWILGVVFASAISASLVMVAEVYFINGHFSEWKVAEIKYEIANLKFPTSYYSTNNIETQNNEDSINHIDKIESFYDRRFVTLLWTMGVLVVLTGVVLPILFAIIQYQSAKAENTDTKNSINDEFTKLRNDFESEVKQNKEKIKSIYNASYTQNAQNYHGFAESWFRQYQEVGGTSAAGTAIVYCAVAISNNLKANNAMGLRSNILMLARIDSLLSDAEHLNDKKTVVNHLKKFRWSVTSSAIRMCMERDNNFAEKYINLSIETYEKITETYGIPNLGENE